MNRSILLSTLFLVAFPGSSFARPVHVIPFSEQLEKADLVVIAHPASPTVYGGDLKRRPVWTVEVKTKFAVEAVIKATQLRNLFSRVCASWTENASPLQPANRKGAKPNAADSRTEKGESETRKNDRTTTSLGPANAGSKRASVAVALADDKNTDVLASYPSSPAFDANADWQRQVGEGEIRMSYFSRGDTKVAMRCVANQSTYQVTTFREVHDHATQSTKTRPLSRSQVLTLRALTKRLRSPDAKPALESLLIVSYVRGKELRVLAFDATKPPPDVIRLYDLTGAYLPATADDDPDEESTPPPANTERDNAASRKLATQFLVAAGMLDEDEELALVGLSYGMHQGPQHGFTRIDIHGPWRFLETVDGGRIRIPGDRKRAYYVMWNARTRMMAIDLVPLRKPSVGYSANPIPDGWIPFFRSSTDKTFHWQQDPGTGEVSVAPVAVVEVQSAPN